MIRRLTATIGFLNGVARDVAGTFRTRWRRFHDRVVLGVPCATVAIDIYPFFERMTGVGWYEWHLLTALGRRHDGLHYNLYGKMFLAPDQPSPPATPDGDTVRHRVHQIPAGFLLPVRPTLSVLRLFVEPILKLLDGNDVLFAPNFFPQCDQEPFAHAQVVTIHDLAFVAMPEAVSPETRAGLARRLPRTLFATDRMIVVSDATARDLVDHLEVRAERVHTIHEAADPAFASGSPSRPPDLPGSYLLFVSTLEPRKNVEGIIRAFDLLVEWGYDGDLILVGRWGWNTQRIRTALAGAAARQRIRHIDYVDREDLPALYRHADALLFPSWLEGFGLPLLESMVCGTPVITSGRSAMPEIAGPAAVYVDPASPHGIASATASLLEDEQHRERLAVLGRERAAAFSWEEAAAATAQVLRQAAGLPAEGPDEYRA